MVDSTHYQAGKESLPTPGLGRHLNCVLGI